MDTPLLIQWLGLEGIPKKNATIELINLLRNLNGNIAAFTHSVDELNAVLTNAARYLDSPRRHGQIVLEARRCGTTRSDLILLSERLEDALSNLDIDITPTPKYNPKFQIGEEDFQEILEDELSYLNPRAKLHDINSVRSIYALREGKSPRYLEKSVAVLVTSNTAFARAAWNYGQQYNETREISSVITNFSLANMAWLKAPMGAPLIPTSELLAFSYAALQPSMDLLNEYLREIEKLEKQGTIDVQDHQILRSSPLVYDELVGLTLGDEKALTTETISETLLHVSSDIKKKETQKLIAEEQAHRITRERLKKSQEQHADIQEHIYWRSNRQATICANTFTGVLGMLLVAYLIIGIIEIPQRPLIVWAIALSILAAGGILAVMNLLVGVTAITLRQRMRNWLFVRLLKCNAKNAGISMGLSSYEHITDPSVEQALGTSHGVEE